jgi:peptidoglycan/xylan/chitin deacetylase (PgdA/CDA1 family)
MYEGVMPSDDERGTMMWDEIGELAQAGWQIGAHTVTHPNLSELSTEDPSGNRLREELGSCDDTIEERLGFRPKDFAFTGTSWSSAAENEVMERYRFGRLWIVGSEYNADGEPIRCADLVGVVGDDEEDGGSPVAARYITRQCNPYRLPSMEMTQLIQTPKAFRKYLGGALSE